MLTRRRYVSFHMNLWGNRRKKAFNVFVRVVHTPKNERKVYQIAITAGIELMDKEGEYFK